MSKLCEPACARFPNRGPAGATAVPTVTCSVNRRLGESTTAAQMLKAERPNHAWALDFQHDATDDGRELKLLNVVDEFTREALVIEGDRTINAEEAVKVLERLAAERGAPAAGRQRTRADCSCPEGMVPVRSTDTAYIEPGSPWQNAYMESFNARLRDELLNVGQLISLAEAQMLAADWRQGYNANHPHSALGMVLPATTRRLNQSRTLTRGGPMNGSGHRFRYRAYWHAYKHLKRNLEERS